MIQINMEKPTHCLRCPMLNRAAECVLIQEIDTSWDWKELYANCPLQEVKSERKKGKWIIDGHHIKCNQCGEYMCNQDREGDEIPRNFCPSCGAVMIGEQE